ncbi:MAG TPA: biopolymer transporter ExbD [Caulobacteraceae bacterium]|jgi:biopolymer transport protein ExbD|nr:biopolymer transporter ExbD [Caulobacteraceae bacterium]
MAAKLAGGGGGKKYDLGQNADINVTPFVDVMLVLLIIFMVSAPLATVSIKVDLPPATPPPPNAPKPKDPVYISIHKSGQLAISDRAATNLDRLIPDVSQALANFDPSKPPKDQTVLIRADREVLYEDFMQVVNLLQQNAYYKVGLISEDL